MFALFEAGLQRNHTEPKPHVSAAPHVGLTKWHLSEVLLLTWLTYYFLRGPYQFEILKSLLFSLFPTVLRR